MPGYGGTQRLARLVGRRRALAMMLSGERIPAQTTLEWGLVNRVVPRERVLEEAIQWAQQLAGGPPLAMRGILDAVVRGTDVDLEQGLAIERENMLSVIRTEDAIEGVASFFQKKTPSFKGGESGRPLRRVCWAIWFKERPSRGAPLFLEENSLSESSKRQES